MLSYCRNWNVKRWSSTEILTQATRGDRHLPRIRIASMDRDALDTGNAVLPKDVQKERVNVAVLRSLQLPQNVRWRRYTKSHVYLILSDKNNTLDNNSLSGSCFPQITLLKPKGKSLPNVSRGSSCNDDNQQPAIASRSLSALTDRSSKESKNICKGASGDKIDTNGEQIKQQYNIACK